MLKNATQMACGEEKWKKIGGFRKIILVGPKDFSRTAFVFSFFETATRERLNTQIHYGP